MKKRININDVPKPFKIVFALFPLFLIIAISFKLDNDFYFLYPTGEYIVNNGFPTHDFLSMHSGMEMIVQQWLTTVIFYFIYSAFGETGMMLLLVATFLLFALVCYKLYMVITGNHFVSCIMAFFSDFAISIFTRTRPQIFTYIILAIELYLLEKYVKTGKISSLAVIPVLSIILVNTHSSMWVLIFVFMLPYIAASIPVKIRRINYTPCCKILPLIIIAVVSFIAGFLNPYGFKAMTYIKTSFGYDEISNLISEMSFVSYTSFIGILIYLAIAITVAIMIFCKGEISTRFFFLYAGLVVFSLMSYKSIPYFFIGGMPAFSYFIKDFSFDLKVEKSNNKKTTVLLLTAVIVAVAGIIGLLVVTADTDDIPSNESEKISSYGQLDQIIDILDEKKAGAEEITLYAGFNDGQYVEFKGYHPYIDGRAELFLEDNNNEFNYIKEYYDLRNGKIYYKDFLDKYSFNYLIITENDRYLFTSIMHDDDYELIFDGKAQKKEIEEKYRTTEEKPEEENEEENDADEKFCSHYLFALKNR